MRNLTMMTDLYQLTMMYGYYKFGMTKNQAVFDVFFRENMPNSGYTIMAGLDTAIDYIKNIHFGPEDIEYLRGLKLFDEGFLKVLSEMHFTGEVYAIPEGTPVFPYEPLVRVKAPIMEAQLVETTLLNIINHQTLIATKASRVVYAADGGAVLEFGLRRAQGPDAGTYGARAAIIGGCSSTSNVLAGQLYDVAIAGTHAHSWVMSFPTELDAFRAYADIFPDSCMLLVDTYDTLKSGVPNAIKVFDELRAKGHKPVGIRLDSGDLAYFSKEARRMLDAAGYQDARIFASSDLDEYVIRELKAQGARIDVWGVGTKMITSYDWPALGGVYKMSAEIVDGKMTPKIKISENVGKITNPGFKKVYRFFERENGMAEADYICMHDETVDDTKPLEICDPEARWKRKTMENFRAQELLVPIFEKGRLVYELPALDDIRRRCAYEVSTLWPEVKRFDFPHQYYVDLSEKLMALKDEMLEAKR